MGVYVDDMYQHPLGQYRGMKMSHMLADTSEELLAMADLIGVDRRWIQHAGTHREHFDIAMSKRALAVANGAIEITIWEAAAFRRTRRQGAADQATTDDSGAVPDDIRPPLDK